MSNGGTVVEFSAGMQVGPDERYEIVRICGRGGMGVVYEAIDHGLDRPRKVALKQLNKVFAQDRRSVKMVTQEVGIARELRHPNICGVYEYINWRDEHIIIMEWIGGSTLSDELFNQPDNRYSPDNALKLLKPISAALDYAHKRKPPVVHRDLKPLNVMLTEDGDVKVTDFGLSREVKESVTRVTGKESSGSLEYMPFEQYMGEPPHPLQDIYAFGITAYELLNGKPPFTRGDLGLQHKDKMPPAIADIPKPVMDVILKCLSKDEHERYKSAGQFAQAFESAVKGEAPHDEVKREKPAKQPQVSTSIKSAPTSGEPLLPGICPKCGFKNADTVKYCKSCGTNLTEKCPECGNEDRVGTPFCGSCGLNISQFREFESLKKTAEDFLKANDYEPAIEGLKKALKIKKDDEAGKLLKEAEEKHLRLKQLKADIDPALKGNDFDKAEDILKEALNLKPGDEELTQQLEDLPKRKAEYEAVPLRKKLEGHIESKNLTAAMKSAEDILTIIPDDDVKATQDGLKKKLGKVNDLINDARDELSNKNYAEVIKSVENVFELDSFHGEGQQLKDEAQSNLYKIDNLKKEAEAALSDGRLDDVEGFLNDALVISPNDDWVMGKLADLPEMRKVQRVNKLKNELKNHVETKHLQLALNVVEKILDLSPDDVDAQAAHKKITAKLTKVEDMLSEARKALSNKNFQMVIELTSKIPEHVHRNHQEIDQLKAKAVTKLAQLTLKHAREELSNKNYAIVIKSADKVLKLDPNNEEARQLKYQAQPLLDKFNNLKKEAEAALSDGSVHEAKKMLNAALEISPNDEQIKDMLAEVSELAITQQIATLRSKLKSQLDDNHLEMALDTIDNILFINLDDSDAKEAQKGITAKLAEVEELLIEARGALSSGNLQEVMDLTAKIPEIVTDHKETGQLRAEAVTKLWQLTELKKSIESALEEKKIADAEELLNEALEISQDDEWLQDKLIKLPELIKAQQIERLNRVLETHLESRHLQLALNTVKQILAISSKDTDAQATYKEITAKITKVEDLLIDAKKAHSNENIQMVMDLTSKILELDADNQEAKSLSKEAIGNRRKILSQKTAKWATASFIIILAIVFSFQWISNEGNIADTKEKVETAEKPIERQRWEHTAEIQGLIGIDLPFHKGRGIDLDNYPGLIIEEKGAEEKRKAEIEERERIEKLTGKMVFVKGDTFQMGSNNGDDDEKPNHTVTVSDFYIGKTEVTQAQWKTVMGNNPSHFKGDNLPVERVSWNNIQIFLKKLNQKTRLKNTGGQAGKNFRLPTYAEWEYAARGGRKSKGFKYAGSNIIDEVAWYNGNSGSKTHPVGQKQPNELELYDMCGNVWEWCNDMHGSLYPIRGGNFDFGGISLGSAFRMSNHPSNVGRIPGFRLARSANNKVNTAPSEPIEPTHAMRHPEKYLVIETDYTLKIDYSQANQAKGERGVNFWEVFSDRENNQTYYTPEGTRYKHIHFLDPFWVMEERGEWLHIIKDDNFEENFTVRAEDFGWIHKSKLILSKSCLITNEGEIERKAMLINPLEILQDKTDFGDLEIVKNMNQHTYFQKKEYLTGYSSMLHEIFYIFKSESYKGKEYVLLSTIPRIPHREEMRETKIIGWASKSRLTFWNTRVALEPNWEKKAIKERRRGKRVKYFHVKSDARNYKNGKKVDKDNVYWSEKIADQRLDGEFWRFPLLRVDKNDPDIITAVVMGMVKIDSVDIPLARKATTALNIKGQQYPLLRKVILMDIRSLSNSVNHALELLTAWSKSDQRNEVYTIWVNRLMDMLGEDESYVQNLTFEAILEKEQGLPDTDNYLTWHGIKTVEDLRDETVMTNKILRGYLNNIELIAEELNERINVGRDHPTAFVSNDVIYFWVEVELLP